MPNKDYILTMAKYNLWQNENLTAAANGLSVVERQLDRGSFFGSIQQTFSHILWGDHIWVSRFAGTEAPTLEIHESMNHFPDWDGFLDERTRFDRVILDWAHNAGPDLFEGDLTWFSGAVNREVSKPKTTLLIQLFNHQTHHRGQIHAMLTASGAKPDDTDVPFMPERYEAM